MHCSRARSPALLGLKATGSLEVFFYRNRYHTVPLSTTTPGIYSHSLRIIRAPKTRRSKSNFGIVHEESFIFDKDKGNTGEGQQAPAFEEGEASAAGHEGNLNPDLDYWVEMVSEEGDMFYYHTETNVTQWEVPEGPDVVILSMDDLKKVIDPKGGGGELAISNRV